MLDTTQSAWEDDTLNALRVPLFHVTGAKPGPRLVVTGPKQLVRPLADRLWDTPGLNGIRGELVLREDDQDPAFDRPDAILTLTGKNLDQRTSFFHVLGRMTALGMILGRGVPHRWVA